MKGFTRQEYRAELRRSAMNDGTLMGLFWIGKFVLFPIGLTHAWAQLLFFALTIYVPFLGYRFCRNFRNHWDMGCISFTNAFYYTLLLYGFASMLAAAGHYLYFQFIDDGYIIDTYIDMWAQLKASAGDALAPIIDQYDKTLELIASLTPLEITFQLFANNLFSCVILALITALIARRSQPIEGWGAYADDENHEIVEENAQPSREASVSSDNETNAEENDAPDAKQQSDAAPDAKQDDDEKPSGENRS